MARFTNVAVLTYDGKTVRSNEVTGTILDGSAFTKTAASETYEARAVLTYVIALRNETCRDWEDLTITDDLGEQTRGGTEPNPLTYVDGSVMLYIDGELQPDPVTVAGDDLEFRCITVPACGSMVLVYRAQVNNSAPLGRGASITNTASVSCGGCTLTAEETVYFKTAEGVTITKTLDPEIAEPGDTLTYTFVIRNIGDARVARLTDVFDPVLKNIAVTQDGKRRTDYTYSEQTGSFAMDVTVPAAEHKTAEVTITVTGTI